MNELQHIEETIERLTRAAWYETAMQFTRIRDEKIFRQGGWQTWDDYCDLRWNRKSNSIDEQIARAREMAKMVEISTISTTLIPSSMSHATALAKLETAKERALVWQRVLAYTNGSGITAQVVKGEVARFEAEKAKDWITLDEWNELEPEEQQRLLNQSYGSTKHFNKQDGNNIEWARWSWNPITGCLHNCPYCYARDIANEIYPYKFAPAIRPDRLGEPQNTKVPDLSKFENDVDRIGWRNVFTCSMADLFGKWVPDAWIEAVLQQAWDNPQWNLLFLTKFPIRMAEFDYPPNAWIGTTVDCQYAVERAEKAFRKVRASGYTGIAWLSCEPMMERLTFSSLDMFDWVVIGGASKSTQTPAYRPPIRDTIHLVNQADKAGIPVYMKTNLGIEDESRTREYPW